MWVVWVQIYWIVMVLSEQRNVNVEECEEEVGYLGLQQKHTVLVESYTNNHEGEEEYQEVDWVFCEKKDMFMWSIDGRDIWQEDWHCRESRAFEIKPF